MRLMRWGIIGTGFAARKFVQGMRATNSSVAVAVCSRSLLNAQSFAKEFGIVVAMNDCIQVVNLDDIDVVYIASPPSFHQEHALMAINAGKHVVIEKPFAMNASEAKVIVHAAQERNLFCMEAMWTRFLPAIKQAKLIIESGKIGNICKMSGVFSIADIPSQNNNLFNVSLGGGALLHRGVYPLSLAVYFMGLPDRISSEMIIGDSGVDVETSIILRYINKNLLADIHASTRTTGANDFWLLGSKGSIHIQAPIYRPCRLTLKVENPRKAIGFRKSYFSQLKESGIIQGLYQRFGAFIFPLLSRKVKTIFFPYSGNGYHYQVDAVCRAIINGELECEEMPVSETIGLMEIIDDIKKNS